MVGNNSEKDFSLENYENFYKHHRFEPIFEDHSTSINEYIPRFSWAFDQIEELGAKTVLDLGCLDGSFLLTLARQLGVRGGGIDLTVDGIKIAEERAKKFKLDVTFIQGTVEENLEELAKLGAKYDVVTMFELIEHVKDVPRLLKLIDGVLKPGGSVLVSTPAFESPVYGADDEVNKCHIRLYTMEPKDYEQENKFGHVRKATSIVKEIGANRIKEMAIHNHLINLRYE